MPKGRKRHKAKGRHKKRGVIPAKKMSPISHESLSTTVECSSSAEDSESSARHPGKNLASEVGRCLLSSTMGPAAGLMGTRRHFAKTGFLGEAEEIQQLKTDIRAQIDVFLRVADVVMLRTKLQQLLKQNRTLLDQQLQRAAKSKTTSLPDQAIPPRASKHGRRSSSRGTTRRQSAASLPTSANKSADHSKHNTSALRSRSRSTSSSGPRKGISASSDLPPIDSIGTASENVTSSIKLAAAASGARSKSPLRLRLSSTTIAPDRGDGTSTPGPDSVAAPLQKSTKIPSSSGMTPDGALISRSVADTVANAAAASGARLKAPKRRRVPSATTIAPDIPSAPVPDSVSAPLQTSTKTSSSTGMTPEGVRAQQLSSRSPAQTVAKLKEVAAAAAVRSKAPLRHRPRSASALGTEEGEVSANHTTTITTTNRPRRARSAPRTRAKPLGQKQRMNSIGPLLRTLDDSATIATPTPSTTTTTTSSSVSNRQRIMQRVKKVVTMFANKHQQNQNKNLSAKDSESAVSGTPGGLFKVAMAAQPASIPPKKQPNKIAPKLPPDAESTTSSGPSSPRTNSNTSPRTTLFQAVMAPMLPAKKTVAKKHTVKKNSGKKNPGKKLPPVKMSPIKVKPSKESSSEDT